MKYSNCFSDENVIFANKYIEYAIINDRLR